MKNIQRIIILGGRGKMAGFLLPYLPSPVTLIDVKDFEKVSGEFLPSDKAVRKRTSAELSIASRNGHLNRFSTLFLLSVPAETYDDTMRLPGKNRIASLIGTSGRGHKLTLFVHQTSVHTTPAKLLEPVSGVVLGMHLLHGPNVTDLSQETAIITATSTKRNHDQYNAAFDALNQLLRQKMKYGHVFQMEPDKHDMIMSNIQFLTHSMLLILADSIISSGFEINDANSTDLPRDLLQIAGRMFKQEVHVYRGIATSNPFNIAITEKIKGLSDCRSSSIEEWIWSAFLQFKSIRDHIITQASMTESEVKRISTPMSRVRDGLIKSIESIKPTGTGRIDISLKDHAEKYVKAVESGYDAYFKNLGERVNQELQKLDFEKITMSRYERMR